jgi:hypothetical protein
MTFRDGAQVLLDPKNVEYQSLDALRQASWRKQEIS